MTRSRSFFPIFIPGVTVFISSACIMMLELIAARLVARDLGSSLYTWTSVIGVVLAGITIGNYLGGRIADRSDARKALAVLFLISSAACVLTVILNNLVGGLIWLWHLNWPVRVFSHVFLVFLIPSMLLGTISPVVAKIALDKGLPRGRTVGDIYAWGAAGSIAGTFIAGYYLIDAMGTAAIIWMIGAGILLMAILYRPRLWVAYVWAVIYIALTTMATAPMKFAEYSGSALALREKKVPGILYEDESPYCYIAVKQLSNNPDKREFVQDKLTHSIVVMNNIRRLEYCYERIYAAVTHRLSVGKSKLSVFGIGGGGFVFPRYIMEVCPGSRVDVAEIDPGVTKAAMKAFGLQKDTPINIFTMDARNYVDKLLQRMDNGRTARRYDFIYGDAFNDYSVPYQLVTKEFNDKIAQILTDDGVYMINVVDIYDSGLFLGACVNTLEETFPYVYVVTENKARPKRNTFVIIASKEDFNLEGLNLEEPAQDSDLWILSDSDIEALRKKASGIVLTDNYSPVENMLAPVVRRSTIGFLLEKYQVLAQEHKYWGSPDESIAMFRDLIKVDPTMSIKAYSEIAAIRTKEGKLLEAAEALQQAIEYNEKAQIKTNIAGIHFDFGFLLKELKQPGQSKEHFLKAIEGFREKLARTPRSVETTTRLGIALAEVGQFDEAAEYLQQAVNIDPNDAEKYIMLARAFVTQRHYDEAIEQLNKGLGLMLESGRKDDAVRLQKFLEMIKLEKSKHKKQ